eukprot:scaffold13583_cov27-Tisochrysis_lutea.AAC.1
MLQQLERSGRLDALAPLALGLQRLDASCCRQGCSRLCQPGERAARGAGLLEEGRCRGRGGRASPPLLAGAPPARAFFR